MAKRLDLSKDFAAVYAYLAKRVKAFDPAANDGPGDGGPVTRIDFGFGYDQDGWVALVFDTRRDAEPDGEWNEHIEGNDVPRPRWPAACEAIEEEPLTLTLPDGTKRELPAGAAGALATALGDMLRDVLLKARADGLFAGLRKSKKCELGVEEQNGEYGWPTAKERGKGSRA